MYERRVTHIHTNNKGNIIALANLNSEWESVSSTAVIFHIKHNMYRYYVAEEEYRSYVQVKHKECQNILTTEEDQASANNLHNLPLFKPGDQR